MMNYGAWNHSVESRPMELNLQAKARLRAEIDQHIAEFLASGGQIRTFELIQRDDKGVPFNPDNKKKG